MTEEQRPKRGWQKYQNVVLAAVAAVIAGLAIGWALAGGDSSPSDTTVAGAAPSTQPLEPVTTTTTTPAPPSTDAPGQISFPATEDTYVNDGDPDDNNGSSDTIEVRTDETEVERGLIRFDVRGIPEGETIRSATLRLYVEDDSDNAVDVHLVEGDWTQVDTTGANAPEMGEQIANFRATPAGSFVEIDVTSVVTEPGQYDFYLVSVGSDSAEFAATEEGENVPTLVVNWLEDPGDASRQGSPTLAETSNVTQ